MRAVILAAGVGAFQPKLLRLDGLDPTGDDQGQLVWGSLAEAPEAFRQWSDNPAAVTKIPVALE